MLSKPIVFVGDMHLSDRQISTRVDDTTETCLAKFEWVLGYAASMGADVITTGDMFTHTLFNNKTRYRIKKALTNYSRHGLRFVSIGGNHSGDVEGRDPATAPYRELGQFCLDGYVNFLGEFDGGFWDYDITDGSVIRGYSAYHELAVGNPEKVIGLVCHCWVGSECFGDSLVVYPDDMKKVFPNLQFIVSGHDHESHESYRSRDGVFVIRPGSMMRTDSGKSLNRNPHVVVWYPDKGLWMDVPIVCARPYSEVFYSEKKEVDVGSVNALDRFVNQMRDKAGLVLDINSAVREQFALVPLEDQELVHKDLVSEGFWVGTS